MTAAKTTYRDVFLNPQEGGYYLMPVRAAEDRGGSSKATGLILADSIDKLLAVPREGTIYQARNGALFHVGNNCNYTGKQRDRIPLNVVQVVNKTFNPESSGWYSLVDDDGDEDLVNVNQPHLLVILTDEHWKTHKVTHRMRLTGSWSKAFGILTDDGGCSNTVTTVYQMTPNSDGVMEAKLVSTTASVDGLGEEFDTIPDFSIYRTGFSQYDFSINPYSGCQFGCRYCYAGVYKDYADLPQDKWRGRLVIGTHTDPYQPREAEQKLTQDTLRALLAHAQENPGVITKIGIFTRGLLVTRDLDLIRQLPNPVIHFDLSPFPEEWRQELEQSSPNAERLPVLQQIKDAGIKLILNICPCVPKLSEDVLRSEDFLRAYELADEICVGLLLLYGGIPEKMRAHLPPKTLALLQERGWEDDFMAECRKVFRPFYGQKLVIWRDRTRKGWRRMSDKSLLPQEFYTE